MSPRAATPARAARRARARVRGRDRRAVRARPAPQALPDAALGGPRAARAMLSRAIDVAAELGAPVVSLWSGAAPTNLEPRGRLGAAARGDATRVLTHAERRGVRLGFEPEPGMFVERLGDFEALDRRLGAPDGARPHARHRALRLPRARAGAGLHPAGGAAARPRPHRGHAARRPRAPDVRRRRARPGGRARRAAGDRLRRHDRRWSSRATPTPPTRRSRARSRCCGAANARR